MPIKLRSGAAAVVAKFAVVLFTVFVLSMVPGPGARSSAEGSAVLDSVMDQAVLAATTACGTSCTSPVNLGLGTGQTPTITITGSGCPAVTAAGLESAAGNSSCTISVAMAAATSGNAGQDWVAMEEGTVDKFIADQALSEWLDIQYGSDEVVEFEAAPDGVASDMCLVPGSGATATLQQCGKAASLQTATSSSFSGTAWILDAGNTSNGYLDVISGFDQLYSDPSVLTAASGGSLSLSSLSEIGGVVSPTQMWAFEFASASAATLKKEGIRRT